ncbi:heparinase II/III family protein [Actinomycetospora cinnamomea]|uniref:Heparinase II/III-like protein n=1 Tax=Actinomycetospora cinnamomea TaxID=663609 RepID=A0A2U1F736_9PSEU|nr:alginate lyase family protein [Actinomycetospora cinnamomea]PVZ07993.1 heparinase II/III-like protein [Actinomycetospora cinnamomea]
MRRVGWYVNRLRAMGPQEVAGRAGRMAAGLAREALERREVPDERLLADPHRTWDARLADFRAGTGRPVLLDRATAEKLAAEYPEDTEAVVAAAERVLEHRFTFFGHPEARYDGPIDWSYDPLADVRWPRMPSRRIDHRVGTGDPKWIWELNRLQHLPWLAQAWLVTGDRRFADEALDQLDDWILANPPGTGIAWRGAFEAGVRAIAVTVALQGLADAPGLTPERYRRVVRVLAASATACRRDRSRFSSANNHLVGEMAGLAVVGLCFPELARAERWTALAVAELATQADLQILADGAGAEQAVGYQVFTAELLGVVVLLLELAGRPAPPALRAAVDRSATYLASLVGPDDPTPRYGDDDEGFALRLGPEPLREVRPHLAAVAALTGHRAAAACSVPDLTAGWFGKARGVPRPEPAPALEPGSFHAEQGGLVVLRAGDRRVTVDVGPLGYLSIAAHGHADALAVTLSRGGRELVGDPGTGSYFAHPDWRTAHRGTRAHPTVAVDDRDQSVMGGEFLWSRHARTTVEEVDLTRGLVHAHHDGYEALEAPVRHHRWVVAPPDEATVLVVDLLEGRGQHRVRTSWPLHPGLRAAPDEDGHLATDGTGAPVLGLTHAATTPWIHHHVRGDEETHLGWWSDRLEAREPSWLVGGLCERGRVPLAVATLLTPGSERATGASVQLTDDAVVVGWSEGRRTREVRLDRPAPVAGTDQAGDRPRDTHLQHRRPGPRHG